MSPDAQSNPDTTPDDVADLLEIAHELTLALKAYNALLNGGGR